MNHTDTPASEPRVVERHSLLVEITIDELGRIGYAITPDRDVQDTAGVTCLELARRGAPISRVAMAMLVHELDRRLLVDSRHPARHLLDQMVEAGSLWVEEGNPSRGMFPAMQQIVETLSLDLSELRTVS